MNPTLDSSVIAYFSMEIGLDPSLPTYSGGLGMLAGDTLRSAADLEIPMVGVTLLYRNGYFRQKLSPDGKQAEEPVTWPIADLLDEVTPRVEVEIEGVPIKIRAWRYLVRGISGFQVPVFLLDSDLPENAPEYRRLTHQLYAGDQRLRLSQEAILGQGGVRMLRALGFPNISRFHLNEGHAALVTLELLMEQDPSIRPDIDEVEARLAAVRAHCIFTTHTPVEAGHDKFPRELAVQVLGQSRTDLLGLFGQKDVINMTEIALRGSRYVNGVALRHGQLSRSMFPGYPIHSITNGIHAGTWASPPFQDLFDEFIPSWRRDSFAFRYAVSIPPERIWEAHLSAKRELLAVVTEATGSALSLEHLTIGFARRSTAYKRALLLFHDLDRLRQICRSHPIQLVFAGKAHPQDFQGKEIIEKIHTLRRELGDNCRLVYLENYDMALGKLITAGVDVWLNTPHPPLEASGTSGMKAALNGVPSLSILDGWWIEGCVDGVTGWSIGALKPFGGPHSGGLPPIGSSDADDAQALYERLENAVAPTFYHHRSRFQEMMRWSISLNASFFNTERMLGQYYHGAYREPRLGSIPPGYPPHI